MPSVPFKAVPNHTTNSLLSTNGPPTPTMSNPSNGRPRPRKRPRRTANESSKKPRKRRSRPRNENTQVHRIRVARAAEGMAWELWAFWLARADRFAERLQTTRAAWTPTWKSTHSFAVYEPAVPYRSLTVITWGIGLLPATNGYGALGTSWAMHSVAELLGSRQGELVRPASPILVVCLWRPQPVRFLTAGQLHPIITRFHSLNFRFPD
ncbi:hypothetical protein RSAG8_07245, partial [Rhizoctonia solani AG-8 WAC10335]